MTASLAPRGRIITIPGLVWVWVCLVVYLSPLVLLFSISFTDERQRVLGCWMLDAGCWLPWALLPSANEQCNQCKQLSNRKSLTCHHLPDLLTWLNIICSARSLPYQVTMICMLWLWKFSNSLIYSVDWMYDDYGTCIDSTRTPSRSMLQKMASIQ